jgi:copper(I)-binding protein/predicted aconitase with swiveling domain
MSGDKERELRCHPGVGDVVRGEALVTDDNFSARYDLDRIKGVFSRPEHKLAGESYVGKILVVNTAKGGVATAWMLNEMAARAMAPKAILLNRANPILAQGAAFAGMALCDRFEDGDVTKLIKTGELVTIHPAEGRVVVEPANPYTAAGAIRRVASLGARDRFENATNWDPSMRRLIAFPAAIAVAACVQSGAVLADGVSISDGWARASIGEGANSAAYMTLSVEGETPDRLVAAATPLAARAELHNHIMEDGVARMRPVEAIEVKPGEPTVLEPGGLHVMLMGLKEQLEPGDELPLTLTFEQVGEVRATLPVRPLGHRPSGGHGG